MRIKSIHRGFGELALRYKVGTFDIERIAEEQKDVEFGNGGVYSKVVYRCYNKNNELLIEMSHEGVAVFYGE